MPSPSLFCSAHPESTLQTILETAVDGIVVIDPQGNILAANKAMGTIFGYSREELQAQPVTVLMPEPYRNNHQSFIDNYLHSGQGRIIGIGEREVPGLRSDGTVIPLQIGVSEVSNSQKSRFLTQGLPLLGRENTFSQPDVLRRDLHHLVLPDKVNGPLQGHGPNRSKDHVLVPAGGPDIGQLLFLARIGV